MSGLVCTGNSGIMDQYPKYYPFALINCITFRLVPCINSA